MRAAQPLAAASADAAAAAATSAAAAVPAAALAAASRTHLPPSRSPSGWPLAPSPSHPHTPKRALRWGRGAAATVGSQPNLCPLSGAQKRCPAPLFSNRSLGLGATPRPAASVHWSRRGPPQCLPASRGAGAGQQCRECRGPSPALRPLSREKGLGNLPCEGRPALNFPTRAGEWPEGGLWVTRWEKSKPQSLGKGQAARSRRSRAPGRWQCAGALLPGRRGTGCGPVLSQHQRRSQCEHEVYPGSIQNPGGHSVPTSRDSRAVLGRYHLVEHRIPILQKTILIFRNL